MEYLYSQTGKTLTPVLQNPEEEDRLVQEVNDEDVKDEGFVEDTMEDITVPVLYEDDPCRDLENRPSSLMTSRQASPPQAPASPADLPSTSLDGGQHTAATSSALPDTSQAALESEINVANEAQVRHINGCFSPISMTFYFTCITINQFIY